MDMLAGRTPPPPQLVFHNRSEYLAFLKKQKGAHHGMYHHRSDWYAAKFEKERKAATVSPVVTSPASEIRSCSDCASRSTPSTTPPTPQLLRPKPIRIRRDQQKIFVPLEQLEAAVLLRHDISTWHKEFQELRARYFKLLPHTRERAEVSRDHRRLCGIHFDGNVAGNAQPLDSEEFSFVQRLERMERDIDRLNWSSNPEKRLEELQAQMCGALNQLGWIAEAVEGYERAAPKLVQRMFKFWESGINLYERMEGPIAGDDKKLRDLGGWLEQVVWKQTQGMLAM